MNALADPVGPIDPRQHYLAGDRPVPRRGDRLRDRRGSEPRLEARPRSPSVVLSVAISLLSGRWPAGRDAARLWYQVDLDRRSRRGARSRRRARSATGSRDRVEPGRRASRRRAGTSTRSPRSATREWVVLDTHDRWLPDDEGSPALVGADAERSSPRFDGASRTIHVARPSSTTDGVYVFRRLSGDYGLGRAMIVISSSR